MEIKYKILRPAAIDPVGIKRDDDSDEWLLPFSPNLLTREEVQPTLGPGNARWLSTGIALELPRNVTARVLFPLYFGRPGLCIVGVEVDFRENGKEVLIYVRNDHPTLDVRYLPGKHYFPIRLSEDVEFSVKQIDPPIVTKAIVPAAAPK